MRKDTILIVLGFAVVAVGTYFILDTTLERTQPELTPVVPDQPSVVQQQKAAKSPKAEELKKAGLPPEEKAKLEQQARSQSAPVTTDEPEAENGAAEVDAQPAESANPASNTEPPEPTSSQPAPDDTATGTDAGSPAGEAAAPEPAADSEAATEKEKLVATAVTNVREAGNKQAKVVGRVMPGDTVSVVEDNDGDWVKIKHDNLQGWVYRSLFKSP